MYNLSTWRKRPVGDPTDRVTIKINNINLRELDFDREMEAVTSLRNRCALGETIY